MLDDMPKPSTFLESPEEPAPDMQRAGMLAQTGQERQEALPKLWDPVGWPVLELLEIELNPDHRSHAVAVGTAVDAFGENAHWWMFFCLQ
jgi:hypothetical protein